jgi:hypothetical protein
MAQRVDWKRAVDAAFPVSVTKLQPKSFGTQRSGSSSVSRVLKEENGTKDRMKYKQGRRQPYCFSRLEMCIWAWFHAERARGFAGLRVKCG